MQSKKAIEKIKADADIVMTVADRELSIIKACAKNDHPMSHVDVRIRVLRNMIKILGYETFTDENGRKVFVS